LVWLSIHWTWGNWYCILLRVFIAYDIYDCPSNVSDLYKCPAHDYPFYLRTIIDSLEHQHVLIQNSEKLLDFPFHFLDLLCKLACNKGIRIQNLIIFVLSNGGAVLFVTASGILSVLKDLCK